MKNNYKPLSFVSQTQQGFQYSRTQYTPNRTYDVYPVSSHEDQSRDLQISQTIQKLRIKENSQVQVEDQMKSQISDIRKQLEMEQIQLNQDINDLKKQLDEQIEIQKKKQQEEINELKSQQNEITLFIQNESNIQAKLQEQLKDTIKQRQYKIDELDDKECYFKKEIDANIHSCEIVNQEKILNLQNQITEEQMIFEEKMNNHRSNHKMQENSFKDKISLKDEVIFKLERELNLLKSEIEEVDQQCEKGMYQAQEKIRHTDRIKHKTEQEIQQLRDEYSEASKLNSIQQREINLIQADVRRLKDENLELENEIFKLKKHVFGRNTAK